MGSCGSGFVARRKAVPHRLKMDVQYAAGSINQLMRGGTEMIRTQREAMI